MRDIETLLERDTARGKLTVECEREQGGAEWWLLTLRLNDVLMASRHADFPQEDAEELADEFE